MGQGIIYQYKKNQKTIKKPKDDDEAEPRRKHGAQLREKNNQKPAALILVQYSDHEADEVFQQRFLNSTEGEA